MPAKKKSPTSIDSDRLRQLKNKGAVSVVLDARLDYMEIEGLARYVRAMTEAERVYPGMLPTQADGRFSTTDPPLVNFPAHLRGGSRYDPTLGKPIIPPPLIVPDEGWVWVSHDWSALHARIAVAYSRDPVDIDAFNNDYDVHTLTACGMWGIPLPPVRTKSLHTSAECASWRALWNPPWEGDDDRRRRLAKIMRYSTLLGVNEMSVLQSKDIEKERLTRQEALSFARQYLGAKPLLVAAKKRIWEQCAKTGKSVTFMGRGRRLFGDWWARAKEGWAHMLQGGEADMMTTYLIDFDRTFPEGYLVLNSHDGATLAFPNTVNVAMVHARLKQSAERKWLIEGIEVATPADWKIWTPDGTVSKLK